MNTDTRNAESVEEVNSQNHRNFFFKRIRKPPPTQKLIARNTVVPGTSKYNEDYTKYLSETFMRINWYVQMFYRVHPDYPRSEYIIHSNFYYFLCDEYVQNLNYSTVSDYFNNKVLIKTKFEEFKKSNNNVYLNTAKDLIENYLSQIQRSTHLLSNADDEDRIINNVDEIILKTDFNEYLHYYILQESDSFLNNIMRNTLNKGGKSRKGVKSRKNKKTVRARKSRKSSKW